MADKKSASPARVPRHVAIIMDGNGRWARKRRLLRVAGHRAGAEAVRAAVAGCAKRGVEYLTVYAFSVENWKRPKAEVQTLMRLLGKFLRDTTAELVERNVQLQTIGRTEDLPAAVQRDLEAAMHATRKNTGLVLVLALSYGGRAELVDAMQKIAQEVKAGRLSPTGINERTIAEHLYTRGIPDPDLLIRTSGEMRLSNFLLWQLSYTELYITSVLWPDFREEHLAEALAEYASRQRRFGGL